MGCPQSILSPVSCRTASIERVSFRKISEDVNHSPPASHASHPKPESNQPSQDAIAIVGIGCRTPGADNIRDFWRVLVNGECHVSDVPEDRWNSTAYLDTEDRMAYGKAYVQKGGFIKEIGAFDNTLYGINDLEASKMDPQQCLLLDCTMMALQDAGITRQEIAGSNTGVFVGAMNCDANGDFTGCTSKVDTYTATDIGMSIIANRVSHVFDLRGPSMVVDTACSASLVALHLGCQAILSGDCDMAICGGVNVMTMPDMFIHLSKAGMISPTGLCHTFSKNADGYTRGEGCGVVILKRLSNVQQKSDKLWATVSTGTNQDGRVEKLITNPSGAQQKKLLKDVYSKFGINIETVDYIEAHGTGTPAGDPVEANALGSFFKEHGSPRDRYIGSVKTNIGHTESAAGVLSIIKILLMMKHGKIVPSLHCSTDEVNPAIDLTGHRLKIPQAAVPWDTEDKTAVCNSFGFGGSNSHAVLQSVRKRTAQEKEPVSFSGLIGQKDSSMGSLSSPPLQTVEVGTSGQDATVSPTLGRNQKTLDTHFLVCFSGKTTESLRKSMEDLLADSEAMALSIHDVAYTSTVRRDHYLHRAAFLAEDMQDLHAQIDTCLSEMGTTPPSARKSKPDVVFVFSGMVPVWDGMCRELLEDNSFREAVQKVDNHLQSYVSWSLVERLMTEDPSKDPVLAPISIFACQVGLVEMWRSLGVNPDGVVGQSIGEVAAAYAAGCLSLVDAVRIIYQRSRLLATVTGGAMLLVQNADVGTVHQLVKALQGKATVALEYSPKSCTISVDADAVPALEQQLKAKRITYRHLGLSVAYHSHHVDPCLQEMEKTISMIEALRPNGCDFVSTVTGGRLEHPPGVSHWIKNLRNPVLFGQAIEAVQKRRKDASIAFLEIGPKSVLQAHLKDIFPEKITSAIPSMAKSKERSSFLHALKALYERGADIKFTSLYQDGQLTDVPKYQFDKKHHREKTEAHFFLQDGADVFEKKHPFVVPVRDSRTEFRLLISPLSICSVYDHMLSGRIVIPGAFYVEAGLAIAQYIHSTQEGRQVSVSAQFIQPLSVKKHEVTILRASIQPPKEAGSLQTSVLVHNAGRHLALLTINIEQPSSPQPLNVKHLQSKFKEVRSKEEIYAALRQSGFHYGEAFRLLQGARKNALECVADMSPNTTVLGELQTMCIHPAILDCMLQSSQIVTSEGNQAGAEALPTAIERVVVYGSVEKKMLVHTYLKTETLDGFVLDQQLLSSTGRVIAELMGVRMQILTPQKTSLSQQLISEEWQNAGKLKQVGSANVSSVRSKQVVFTNRDLKPGKLPCQNISYKDRLHMPDFLEEAAATIRSNKDISRVCLLYSGRITEETDGGVLQSHLVSLSCLMQTIVLQLVESNPTVPFVLCTLNAWPGPTDTGTEQEVNPAATALWGLLRTAVVEHVLPYIRAVELHTPPSELTSDSLLSLLDTLEADERLPHCPEMLLTTDTLFTKCLEEETAILLPDHRKQDGKHEASLPPEAIILGKEASATSDLIAVTREENSSDGNRQKLILETFVQPTTEFLSLSISPASLNLRGGPSTHNKVMMALEVAGQTVGSEKQVVSCCPTFVRKETTVPMETTVSAAAMPDYQPGDLTKLTFLWQLGKGMMTGKTTILASDSTKHLAKSLSLMYPNKLAHTVMVEHLGNETRELSETIVSLVLLDSDVMADVKKFWKSPQRLITCSSLLTAEARALISCTIPDVDLCLHDTQLMFQSRELCRAIPELRLWMETNQEEMVSVATALHSSMNGDTADCISQLLGFKSLRMTDISVQLLNDRLFRKDSIYLVVGGLTGLGWMCVEFLAANNAGYVAIVSRSAPSEEKKEKMSNLSAASQCQIKAFQADISCLASLKRMLQAIQQDSNLQLRGVFTGAAVLGDSVFNKIDRKKFERVMSPKVQGAWNLHKLTEGMPLDYFVMHSSVASVLGNMGQGNYSAANAFMDGLAYYRRYRGLAAQTINWGPLDTGLMNGHDAFKRRIQTLGFSIATEQEIHEMLKVALLLNWVQTIPVKIDFDLYCQKLDNTELPVLKFRLQKLTSSSEENQTRSTSVRELDGGMLKDMEAGPERLLACEQYVTELTRRVLSEDHAHISRDANLTALGVDSVNGMMMINVIHRDTSFKIAAVDVLADATIASLARAVDNCIK